MVNVPNCNAFSDDAAPVHIVTSDQVNIDLVCLLPLAR